MMTAEQALAKAQELYGDVHISHEQVWPPTWGGNSQSFWIQDNRGGTVVGSSNDSWEDAFADAAGRMAKDDQPPMDAFDEAYAREIARGWED